MSRIIPLVVLLMLCASVASFGQSRKKKKSQPQSSQQQQPNSQNPYFPKEDFQPEKKGSKKSKSKKVTHNAQQDHEDRMKAVAKAHRKAEKESMKPQYSDPSYFGHKRKPKKRAPGKMKFCKECEIRH